MSPKPYKPYKMYKCKVCKGTGHFPGLNVLKVLKGEAGDVCPACKGAGKFYIEKMSAGLIKCKYCQGKGTTHLDTMNIDDVCPACKGTGLLKKPIINTTETHINEASFPQTPRLPKYEYDIAVSFAGEDRDIVKQYVDTLSPRRISVFYDEYEQVDSWGKDLYEKLDDVYRKKALFCVIFISKYYAQKVWTNHERKSAQARAIQENREYILPVKLDDTEIPGIPATIGYLDIRKIGVHKLAYMTIQKVKSLKSKQT